MVRRIAHWPIGLVLLLVAVLAGVGWQGISALRLRTAPSDPGVSLVYWMAGAQDSDGSLVAGQVDPGLTSPITISDGSAGPWVWVPAAVAAAVVFLLLIAVAVSASRRGLYGRSTLQLLRTAGWAAVAGAAAVAVGRFIIARQFSESADFTPALVWALLGCSVLAVREVLARAGALSTELEGVI
jgi:hypothetical protein